MGRTKSVEQYYDCFPSLVERFEGESRKMAFQSRDVAEYNEWKKALRLRLTEITGLDRLVKAPLEPQILETLDFGDYIREKVLIQTESGVYMPVYVLVPKDMTPSEKRPAIIAPHGHGGGGKLAVVGETSIPAIRERVEEFNYAYGLQYVRLGYIAFCPDARGFGERRVSTRQGDNEDFFLNSSCHQLAHMGLPLGITVTGMWVFDLMCLLDYIETRPECDAGRMACGGLSGGGLQTLWLTAMDDRVQCAIDSGYFYGYKDSLVLLYENCDCNYVPHLWETVDMGDLGALIAPRPLLVESGDEDPLNGYRGLNNVTEQLDIARKAYALFGVEDKLWHHIFHGPHRWDGARTGEFLGHYL